MTARHTRRVRREAERRGLPERDVAHRGYVIRHNPLLGTRWIERDGHRVSGCSSVEDGRAIINSLLD